MADAPPPPDGRAFPRLGSYQILRQLGSGGMSNVFQAIHEESGSIVALKVLPRKLAQNATLLQRFLREAKSAENLDHPNVVAIYDRGFDQGRHYLVLEYVEGRDLFDRVRLNGPLTTLEAIKFIREVALGLQYAAGLGMIHRDVKPANLLLTPEGHAKIIDLGLALQADEEDERVTRDGTTVGTVDYMSPEQARDSRKINERSDIYSLGCTLHYLMTGYPPYPGGNLADKLARHHGAIIPDVRDRVPEIPEDFARLIGRMMAKKPDQRFANYQEMIIALDVIGTQPPTMPAAPIPDVLIDETDEDDDVLELTLAESQTAPSQPITTRTPKVGDETTRTSSQSRATIQPEFSLAELAALDSAEATASTKRRGLRIPGPADPKPPVDLAELSDEATEDLPPGGIRRTRDELPLQTWVAAGVMVGLVLAVVAFGVRFALSILKPADQPQTASSTEDGVDTTSEPRSSNSDSTGPEFAGTYAVSPRPAIVSSNRKSFDPVGPPRAASSSGDGADRSGTEPVFDEKIVARLGFARDPKTSAGDSTSRTIVRRLADPGDPTQTQSLAVALGRPNDIVEIADVGPFHEDDYQVAGKSRVIRGRAGLRPILKIESSRQSTGRDQEAKFILGANGVEQLTLEGIDLAVDVRDLPLTQSSLFVCQGVDLTIRNCSITIANTEDRRNGFSVFRLISGPRPNRLRIEQSLIRGPIQTLVEVSSTKAEISLDQTLILAADGPLFRLDQAERTERNLQFKRSILATHGPLVAWTGKPGATTIRCLGSTIARVEPGPESALLIARNAPATEGSNWLDYDGDYNRWIGWSTFAEWGSGSSLVVLPRPAVGSNQTTPDSASVSASGGWPASTIAESTQATDLSKLVSISSTTVQAIAKPHPNLLELTVDLFNRLPIPDLVPDFGTQPVWPPGLQVVNLDFVPQLNGGLDLGQFLATQVTDPSKHYLVRIGGTGSFYMTPVRLPDGVSVALVGPRGSGSTSPIPLFYAAKAASALIELRGGDLAIENIGFGSETNHRTERWLSLEDSLLTLRRCSYRDSGVTEYPAIDFKAKVSTITPPRSGSFRASLDRPAASLVDCWIWTGSNFFAAEVRRGVIRLENCLVLAGGIGFTLKPGVEQLVDLEADLVLENCTMFEDRLGISLEPSARTATGSGRPWLILSRSSVFPRIGREGGALLGVDPNLFARGAIFWQSSRDVYDVGKFLGSNLGVIPSGGSSADLKRQWVDLWGVVHTRDDRGPSARNSDRLLHFRDTTRPRATRPTPGQLELDPKLHNSQGVNFKNLPPFPRT